MNIETLHREILEAKRCIERNTLIIQFHEQSVAQVKRAAERDALILTLQEQISELQAWASELTAPATEVKDVN